MTTIDLWLLVYPRERAHLREQDFLRAFLESVVQLGAVVVTNDKNGWEALEQGTREPEPRPALAEGVLRDLAAYCQRQRDDLQCLVSLPAVAGQTAITSGLFLDEQELVLMVTDASFKYTLEGVARYERWLTLIELVYQVWSPVFGYLSDGPEWEDSDIYGLAVNRLYELNIFGPEYVAQLGPAAVAELPVWKQQRMADGGMIVVVGTYVRHALPDQDIEPAAAAYQLRLEAPDGMV